jgi:uncharacterized protein (TIGR02996 family)
VSDEAGILAAIRESPADDVPRMVWADWLDDHGRHERAELVRLQLALARGDESGRGREQALLAEHGQMWLDEELPAFTLRTTHEWHELAEDILPCWAAYRRGLAAAIFLPMSQFKSEASKLAQRCPALARVQLLDRWAGPLGEHRLLWQTDARERSSYIPDWLASCMPSPPERDGGHFDFSGFEDALAGLSKACIVHALGGYAEVASRATWTAGEIAKTIGVHPRTVANWRAVHRLVGYQLPGGQGWRVSAGELVAFMRAGFIPLNVLARWSGDLEGISPRPTD